MNPARQAFEDELHKALLDARAGVERLHKLEAQYTDRLIELARRVINEE